MEPQQAAIASTSYHEPAIDETEPSLISMLGGEVERLIGEVLSLNDPATLMRADDRDGGHQSDLLQQIQGAMAMIQSQLPEETHEVETQLGPVAHASIPLQDLVGVNQSSELNQILGLVHLGDNHFYKLRNRVVDTTDFQLAIEDEALPNNFSSTSSVVVLQPTLRNVWVLQHAYAKLLNHKENLIQRYLDETDRDAEESGEFSREYYEELDLANLPSKNKLGNLLDVNYSSLNDAAHEMMLVFAYVDIGGITQYAEAVTGTDINIDRNNDNDSYLILPVVEDSIKKLYDTYRTLRKATSEQRQASKDKALTAGQPVNTVEELQEKFKLNAMLQSSSTGESANQIAKRRRFL
ncbi:hypothetical protein F4819DRAFT_381010 [Hypoxylon fuscum]|nr:hypothetical protein F4819DRAFT_381010 [Hypoxylon fuscum]